MKRSLVAVLAVASMSAQAQGSFDFSQIPGVAASPHVQIDLNPAMLGFVAEAARATDPEAAELLAGIRSVRVSVYEQIADSQPVLDFVDNASAVLEGEGWQRSVFVDDGDDKVRIYMMTEDTQIMGLTIMVAGSSGEAVFVNVDGTIDPLKFGEVAATLGMGGMLGAFGGAFGELGAGAGPGGPGGPGGRGANQGPRPAPDSPNGEASDSPGDADAPDADAPAGDARGADAPADRSGE